MENIFTIKILDRISRITDNTMVLTRIKKHKHTHTHTEVLRYFGRKKKPKKNKT